MSPVAGIAIYAMCGLLVYAWRIERGRVDPELARLDQETREEIADLTSWVRWAPLVILAAVGITVLVAWPVMLVSWAMRRAR